MRSLQALELSFCLIGSAMTVLADEPQLDCRKKSLADAVASARQGDSIRFTGVCAGPVVVSADGLTLTGVGAAVIDGGKRDAVTIASAHGVKLSNIEIRNGASGIVGINGAHIALNSVNVHDNLGFGISLQTSSSAILTDVSSSHNGVHGLDLQTGSAATITGSFASSENRVFGINVNGSSVTFSLATASMTGNAVGVQVATSGNAFLNDAKTILKVNNNLATGLTVVSGAHMVSFGGTINASGNGINGVSLNSKAGLDLDAGSQLNLENNGTFAPGNGLLLQEASVMTVFNIPQFSGVQGYSTVNSRANQGDGVAVETGSTLTFSNQARLISSQNTRDGLLADNGAGITLVNSMLSGNTVKDLVITFGSRADVSTTTFGSSTCDATSIARGAPALTCH
jgi:hypothetical protein